MSSHQHLLRLTVLALLISAGAARAETLAQFTAEALRNNPELRVVEQAIAAAKGGVTTARASSNPELSVVPGVRRVQEGGGEADLFHAELSLTQLFKFPGKRALEIAIAERNLELSELALEAFRFQLSAKVRRAYYEFVAGEKIAQAREDQAESAKSFVESARRRAEAGYGSDFETVKSQAESIAANKAQLQARASAENARVTLNTLLGRPANAAVTTGTHLDDLEPRGSRADFVSLALARNPGIRAQVRQAELAGLSLRASHASRWPEIAVGPSVEYLDNEKTFGFGVTFPLPLWDQKKGEIATATAKQREALAAVEKTRAEVVAEVTRAAANLKFAKRQLALYSPAFLENLKTFSARAEQGYAQNTTTLLIYLEAKRTYYDTLAGYYESLAQLAQTRAELEAAVGVPLDVENSEK